MENENTYYLLGYDQDVVEETLILLAEGEKHPERPITTNVMELVHLLQENKKGARHARLLNEERKREKVRENKRRSREKKRHLKKLLKMKEVCFFYLYRWLRFMCYLWTSRTIISVWYFIPS